ncbi:hypothetical protein ABZV67_45915 [Streptomyces sp. NPDC005065]|uniref:hypothetical protein n=1 Tax=Streptomyces sp. NPDC005065 TaxID=3154461 RepID=UPI0033B3CE9A
MRQQRTKTVRNPATDAHTGGAAPVASPWPAAASSTHTAANTAARKLRTAKEALMVAESSHGNSRDDGKGAPPAP